MSDVRLFNTLSRQQEVFRPLKQGEVRMYCCGPTVYNYIHIGNLRTFLWGDVLRRYLEWKGYRVTQVMNFTDVDDRIIEHARNKAVDLDTYTAPYIEAFFHDIDTLRIRRADIYPRATRHIEDMVELVQKLEQRGHTYLSDGSIYFKIATFPEYGKLSQVQAAETSEFSRIDTDNYDKENARDFVLWKARKEEEPFWDTPIGPGRPGWHLECSAMSIRYLGTTFDIHTGAVDLIFPHHENEIAQSEGATGQRFVNFWIHGEHLIVEERKMSKSAGNFFTLKDLLDQGYSPLQIRFALLSVPHRTKLNFTIKSLEDARNALERLELFILRMKELASEKRPGADRGVSTTGRMLIKNFLHQFEAFMDDDLNTAGALGGLFTMIREANTAADEKALHPEDGRAMVEAIGKVDPVLDILPRDAEMLDSEIERLIEARNLARARRDFAESDRLRDELLRRGIILEDTVAGTRWRRK
jgi:cysteinyl-tRNA synthetase